MTTTAPRAASSTASSSEKAPTNAALVDVHGNPLAIPRPETFASIADERAHRKAKLAAAFRMFSKAGLDEGVAGHITVRDPEEPDTFWVNPFGMHFSLIRSSDLIRVNEDGRVVEGGAAVNGAAVAIHCAVHAARPDALAAAHAHGPAGKTFSSLDMDLEPLTQDACAFYQDIGLLADYHGLVLDDEEGRRVAAALGTHKAVILRNHGMLTVGTSVDAAAWWFLTLERSAECQLQAYAAAAGRGTKPIVIDHDVAVQTREAIGYEFAGWFQFQPIWQRISRDQPDIFD